MSPEHDSQLSPQEILLQLAADSLGFNETPELKLLRSKIEKTAQEEELRNQVIAYQTLAEDENRKITDPNLYQKAQIGLIVITASIYDSLGRDDDFQDTIDDAMMYAFNLGNDQVVETLRALTSKP